MNERGRALLANAIVYIASFPEDRPITHAPQRALLRVGADRVMAKQAADKNYVEWYFTPSVRQSGHAEDWPAFQAWYKQHRDYLVADREHQGSLVLDKDAMSLECPAHRPAFIPAMITALREGGDKANLAAKLLRRYAPVGPKEPNPEAWQAWWEENRPYVFFSESGWYQWYIDPLAKKRGVATAELRGTARATPPSK